MMRVSAANRKRGGLSVIQADQSVKLRHSRRRPLARWILPDATECRVNNPASEVFPGKRAPGTGFEVFLKGSRFVTRAEGNSSFNLPGAVFGRVVALACVVGAETQCNIVRQAGIALAGMRKAYEAVDVDETSV